MAINTNKQIKKVSYNQTTIPSGVDVSNVTTTRDDVLLGKKVVDMNGNLHTGTIQTYAGATSKTSNGTFATANKYVTSNLTVSVDGAAQIYRHANPTIIRLDLRNMYATVQISFPYTMTIKIKQASSGAKAFTLNWGDGTQETISNSTSTQTKTHTYSTGGLYDIVFSPTNQADNRFALTNNNESKDILTFDEYMFGQSQASPFPVPVSIYCGDSTWFSSDSLDYCSFIDVLSFENMNSLLEKTGTTTAYYTQDYLPVTFCRASTIWTLIIGSGIKEFKNNCFIDSTVWDMIIIDARGTGKSTATITVANSGALPNIANKIHINHLRLNAYTNASFWAAKSSQMIGY